MAQKIGSQHGIDAARNRLILKDPEGDVAYKKLMAPAGVGLEGTMHKLVAGHNEFMDDIASLREEVRLRPFS